MNVSLMTTDMLIEKISKMTKDSFATERLCWDLLKYYKEKNPEPTEFQKGWYDSVAKGKPDFSIYDGERYVPEALSCYLIYAKKYIRTASKFIENKYQIKEIWDLGCGIGVSTSLIKTIFPNAEVYGTQLKSEQRKIAEELGREAGFKIKDEMRSSGGAIVFMLDYLEHFISPTGHLIDILSQRPKLLIMANSFGANAPGHFPYYKIDGNTIHNKETGRHLSKWLKSRGYKKIETGFYNGRPAIWELA